MKYIKSHLNLSLTFRIATRKEVSTWFREIHSLAWTPQI
jgi:hypothetical protein